MWYSTFLNSYWSQRYRPSNLNIRKKKSVLVLKRTFFRMFNFDTRYLWIRIRDVLYLIWKVYSRPLKWDTVRFCTLTTLLINFSIFLTKCPLFLIFSMLFTLLYFLILPKIPPCSLIMSCLLNFFWRKFHPALLLGLLVY